jgi:hypothetical protein
MDITVASVPRNLSLWVARADLRQTRWVVDEPVPPLAEGQALLNIDLLALTANNVTYGAFGDAMKYWDFFPTGDPAWGQIPAWGFATVAASRAPGVEVGTRVYGYFPMARSLVVTPTSAGPGGFTDGAPHRAALSGLYNRYQATGHDPLYRAAQEGVIAVLRPLFTTSFLIDDWLAEQAFFDARQIVLSSASSKTAYATAWCLAQRAGLQVVGLTSSRNRAYVQGLGVYSRVEAYESVGSLPKDRSVYIDFAGSAELRRTVHEHWADALACSTAVGATDWEHRAAGSGLRLPGPKPQFFFAPSQAQQRLKEWGGAGFGQRLGQAWSGFTTAALAARPPWLGLREVSGRDEIAAAYRSLVAGEVAPDVGLVLRMSATA